MKKLLRRAAAQKTLGLKIRVTLVIDTIRWEGPLIVGRTRYMPHLETLEKGPKSGPRKQVGAHIRGHGGEPSYT